MTERNNIEIKETSLTLQVTITRHGKKWYVQTLAGEDHILLTTQLVKSAQFTYFDPVKEEPEEEKAKEPEIVECSCGETFDWEHWDRETWPMPKGIHEAVRHLDMGHTLMTPKEAPQ